jgi:hypothetical protein
VLVTAMTMANFSVKEKDETSLANLFVGRFR